MQIKFQQKILNLNLIKVNVYINFDVKNSHASFSTIKYVLPPTYKKHANKIRKLSFLKTYCIDF